VIGTVVRSRLTGIYGIVIGQVSSDFLYVFWSDSEPNELTYGRDLEVIYEQGLKEASGSDSSGGEAKALREWWRGISLEGWKEAGDKEPKEGKVEKSL
tara:strand:+ start:267 stop:560 length:294 start_codon:yes stop_codon:yes gene_type:complete